MPYQFNPITLQTEWIQPPKVTTEMPQFGGAYSTAVDPSRVGPGGAQQLHGMPDLSSFGGGTDDWMQFEDFTGAGGPSGRAMEESFIPPAGPGADEETVRRFHERKVKEAFDGMTDFEKEAYLNQGGVRPKKEIPEKFKKASKESLKTVPDVPEKTKKTLRDDFPFGFGPDGKPKKEGVLSIGNYPDKFGDPQNEYEDVLLDPDTYTGTWRPFEDIFGEIPKEVGGAFAGMGNKERNQLLKMREWYNNKAETQRRETEKNWKQQGLPVGGFSPGTGEYIYTKDDFLDSKIGKEWAETNNPEGKDITSYSKQFTPVGQQLQKAFDEWNNSSVESRQTFFDSGDVVLPSIAASEAEVVAEEEMGPKPEGDFAPTVGGKEGFIDAFIQGKVDHPLSKGGLTHLDPESAYQTALQNWNTLSPDIQAQWGLEEISDVDQEIISATGGADIGGRG